MGKTLSVQSEIKVVVAAAMPLRLWPCLRLVFESCQMQLKHQCSRLKILSAVVNMHKVVKEVCLQCFVQLINKNYWSAVMHRRKCVRNLEREAWGINCSRHHASFIFNPLHPNPSVPILHNVLYKFPKVMTRRICGIIKSFFSW